MSTPTVVELAPGDGTIYVQITEAAIPGPPGPEGPTGAEGQAGPQGATGAAGPPGAAGSGIFIQGTLPDASPPTSPGVSPGDAYLDQTTDGMWVWDGTNWVHMDTMPGPRGPAGAQGPAGPTGPAGAAGPPGAKGNTGAIGPSGPTGAGVVTGGATGAVMVKGSTADYDTRWTTNWLLHTDGNPRIGTGATPASQCVLVARGAAAPAGLPNGTLIFEQPT